MKNLISVIVPVYNSENTIRRCLESILDQTYKHIEVILVDDGSDDSTYEICRKYAKKDKRIKLIHKSNEGPSKARNAALKQASGRYVMFADSDDYVEKNWCEVMSGLMEDGKNQLGICTYYEIDDKEKRCCRDAYNRRYSRFTYSMELLCNPISYYHGVLWNKIYLNSVIRKYKLGFDEKINFGEDFVFNLKYLEHIRKISATSKPLYNYVSTASESLSRYRKEIYKRVDERSALFKEYREYWKKIKLYNIFKMAADAYIVQFYLSENKRIKRLLKKDKTGEYEKYRKYIYNRCIKENAIKNITVDIFRFYKFLRNVYWSYKNYGLKECVYSLYIKTGKKIKRNDKKVLLFCNSKDAEENIMDFYRCIKNEKPAEFYLWYYNQNYTQKMICDGIKRITAGTDIKVIKDKKSLRRGIWDLCITENYGIPEGITNRNVKTMCISPYANSVCLPDSYMPDVYDYTVTGEEKQYTRFGCVLEANKSYADYISGKYEMFIGVPEFTGFKWSEELFNNYEYYSQARKKINIGRNKKFVLINCEVRDYKADAANIDRMIEKYSNNKVEIGVNLITSGYESGHSGEKAARKLAAGYEKKGFIVRKPGESIIPFIAACDCFVTNPCKLAETAVFAGKDVEIYGDKNNIWKKSCLRDITESGTEKCISDMYISKKEYLEKIKKIYAEQL